MRKDEIDKLWRQYNELESQGEIKEALLALEQIVSIKPDAATIWTLLGQNLAEIECWVDSEKSFVKAIELNPKSASAHSGMASMYLDRGLLDEAEIFLFKSIECDPTIAETYSFLGVIESRRGNHLDSERYHRRAIELKPNFEEPYLNLGLALIAQKKFEKAEEYIKKAIEIDPVYKEAIETLAQLKHQMKDNT